ncbi:MAG: GDP-mannose 4,6-dehydratase, partial [Actinobacteria bacterium]|nr:GDP-mannose 4,6-dehydratase [Actinomycetota bacterium]
AGLDWKEHVEIDKKYQRPTEVDALIGDPTKAKKDLGWSAETKWNDLAKLMVDADLKAIS